MLLLKPSLLLHATVLCLLGLGVSLVASADVSKDLSNLSPLFSVAGVWTPNGATDPVTKKNIPVIGYYSQIKLTNGRNGLVLDGWSWDGGDNTTFYPVDAAMLEQNSDGTLTVATSKYLADTQTFGAGSVQIADFNGDGKPDIFLAPYNESPRDPKPIVVFLSNAGGTFSKVIINDPNMAHGATTVNLNGVPTVITTTEFFPSYQYLNGQFVKTTPWSFKTPDGVSHGDVTGLNLALADFSGAGALDVVVGDNCFGPGLPQHYCDGGNFPISIYTVQNLENYTGEPLILTPYFNGKPEYASIPSYIGPGKTHTYRVWTDDFNHDGKPDIVAGTSLFPSTYSMLQMFQNTSANGVRSFVDKTDVLNIDYNVRSTEVDYSMQMLDIDSSGIKTYFLAGGAPYDSSGWNHTAASNYILLNDGTGRLHIYMHSQFQTIADQLSDYLQTQGRSSDHQSDFIEYLTPENKINLVARVLSGQTVNGKEVSQSVFVNVPLQLNPTADYTENITVSDRNGSRLMRTWAGNDTFYDTNASLSPTSIDGGLGFNTSVYSSTLGSYSVTRHDDGTVTVEGNGLKDTLKNIQHLLFSDATIDLAAPSLQIRQGWNLLGNGTSTALSVASFFSDTSKVSAVWKWNSATGRWAFYTPLQSDGGAAYASSKGYDGLTTINGGEGYWVSAQTRFVVPLPAGAVVTSESLQKMPTGWSLIATGDNKTPSQFNALAAPNKPLTTLWAWDAGTSKWMFYSPALDTQGGTALSDYITAHGYLDFRSASKTLGPGVGFWVNKP